MKLAVLTKVLLITGLMLPSAGFAGPTQTGSQNIAVDQAIATYAQQNEIKREKIEAALAPIKTQMQLQAYLVTSKLGFSPLDALSLAAKQRFLASLKFSDKGLASFEYTDLANELTPTQIYRILSLFGMQHDTRMVKSARIETETDRLIMGPDCLWCRTPEDHENYECADNQPHTCVQSPSRICTSNC